MGVFSSGPPWPVSKSDAVLVLQVTVIDINETRIAGEFSFTLTEGNLTAVDALTLRTRSPNSDSKGLFCTAWAALHCRLAHCLPLTGTHQLG